MLKNVIILNNIVQNISSGNNLKIDKNGIGGYAKEQKVSMPH